MTGLLDTLSSPDEIGFGGWRVVKNVVSRSSRDRQRSGGFRRLFADNVPFTNSDLHDQLVDQLFYYDAYIGHAMGGGGLSRYSYTYFSPSYNTDLYNVFPPASGPHCPAYIGDFPSGLYNDCPIFYPTIGLPYQYVPGFVSQVGLVAHWKFDVYEAAMQDSVASLDLTTFTDSNAAGLLGSAANFVASASDWLESSDATFQTGDIKFAFTGWFYPDSAAGADEHVLGRWQAAGNRSYRLIVTGGFLRFEVSNNGTATAGVTHTHVLANGTWTFFAVWHDSVANTINIKVDDETTVSLAHTTGVLAAGTAKFTVGLDEATSDSTLDGRIDSLSFWKTTLPTESELLALYGGGLGMDYPFDSTEICNTGFPFYYLYSALYTSCPVTYGGDMVAGFPYGPQTPIYDPVFSYDYVYCGNYLWSRRGCREAVTLLDEIKTSSGRKIIAGTMSRVYEYNHAAGNWTILAAGLGNAGYTSEQCTCNAIRGMSTTMGGYLLYTNNVDTPLIYFSGDEEQDCTQQSLTPITDLVALGITRAGGVISWKGFVLFYDITEDGERKGGEVIWSDLERPDSFIESDTSFAGRVTIAVSETVLNAAPLGNWLILYTDKGIIRVTLVGGEDVFNFERIHGNAEEDSGSAMKYKFSLIDTGDMHLYVAESDVYAFTQFDTRPMAIPWITRAAGFFFNGITEDDATYSPVNQEACDLVTGGWNANTREAWLSWPTGSNVCPDVTLRLNLKFNVADIVDHGFTAFRFLNPDARPTVGEWLEDLGICPRGSQIAMRSIDGHVCEPGAAVANPPLYVRNETESENLPAHPRSLCTLLEGQSLDDFCQECPANTVFIAASAEDFSLKQCEDDIFYRELLLPGYDAGYDGYACTGDYYEHVGYDSVMQTGAESFRADDEKMCRKVSLEAEPYAQASPSTLECELAYGAQPSCMTWKALTPVSYECVSEFTAAEHEANNTRPDNRFSFPAWRRGVYLSARFRISGIGGGGKFSAMAMEVKVWGQSDR